MTAIGAAGRPRGWWLLALALFVPGSAIAAEPPDAAQIAAHGANGGPACAACHGADGGGSAAAGDPRLAGLAAAYLRRQLDGFADGTRKSGVMDPIAHALDAAERHAMADYFSRLPVPAPSARGATPPASDALGRDLALHGRWSQQVPGCVQCHGPGGLGVGANFPPLAGQPAAYLASQLRAFKDGTRTDDPLGLMRHVAAALSAADIQAVSAWFAAQPARLRASKP